MASAITHFIVGAALALPALESAPIRRALSRWAIPVSSGLLAVAPDLDTFAMRALGIPYGSFFAHRGFFHSPFFLILISTALAWMVAGRGAASLAVLWSCCAITHPLLDMLTDGGSGVHAPVSLLRSAAVLPLAAHPCFAHRNFQVLQPGRIHPVIRAAILRRGIDDRRLGASGA